MATAARISGTGFERAHFIRSPILQLDPNLLRQLDDGSIHVIAPYDERLTRLPVNRFDDMTTVRGVDMHIEARGADGCDGRFGRGVDYAVTRPL